VPGAGSYGIGEILVRLLPVYIRQDADGYAASLCGTPRGGLHYAGASAADHGATPPGYEPADLPGPLIELAGGFA